jgi:large subunit ribosomal protein L1
MKTKSTTATENVPSVSNEVKKVSIKDAIKELRSQEKRKFIQSMDLVVNLQKIDPRKEAINTFVSLPNPPAKKICAFLTKKSPLADTIVKEEFELYKDNKQIKRLAKRYDVFIAVAPLMGAVATKFGRILGPVGKMPTPQGGVIMQETDANIKAMIEKMSKSTRLRIKEKSIKLSVGREDMSDAQLEENIKSVMVEFLNLLPNKKDNIKDIQLKWTMSKPINLEK